jgi:hypothetical protein
MQNASHTDTSEFPDVLRRPDVAQAIRLAAARVSVDDRFAGLEGVMYGRAYSIAYQELPRYDEAKDGSMLGWLAEKVQAGLMREFS